MRPVIPTLVLLIGVAGLYPIQKYMDSIRPAEPATEESLYFASGQRIKKMSLGMSGLLADIYWIRTGQYFGRKVIDAGELGADTRKIDMKLLGPLLNIVVALDPHEIAAYRFGAIFLTEHDPGAAIDLLERGIESNPQQWRLHQDLGFIYWHMGEYQKASETYERGSRVPGAPFWMKDAAGVMTMKGGSREAARSVYSQYLESDDRYIRNQAVLRLLQVDNLDRIDALNQLVSAYTDQFHSCPRDLRMLSRWTTRMGLPVNDRLEPLDPDGNPYFFDPITCTIKPAPGSRFDER
jgi:tetratricopeptide (TPR) repeat protein